MPQFPYCFSLRQKSGVKPHAASTAIHRTLLRAFLPQSRSRCGIVPPAQSSHLNPEPNLPESYPGIRFNFPVLVVKIPQFCAIQNGVKPGCKPCTQKNLVFVCMIGCHTIFLQFDILRKSNWILEGYGIAPVDAKKHTTMGCPQIVC